MTSARFILCATLLTAVHGSAFAATRGADLPAGIVFPSNHTAVFDNSAPLAELNRKVMTVKADFASWDSMEQAVSYSRGNGATGFGLGITRQEEQVAGTAGVGLKVGKLNVGANGTFDIENSSSTFNLGLRFGGDRGLVLGLVAYDIFSYSRHYGVGFGLQGNRVLGELDLDLTPRDGFSLNRVRGQFKVVFMPSSDFSLSIGDYFSVMPNLTVDDLDLELGAHLWVSQKLGLFGLYRGNQSFYTVGISMQF